jgi:hypothetical protein
MDERASEKDLRARTVLQSEESERIERDEPIAAALDLADAAASGSWILIREEYPVLCGLSQ